MYILWEIRCQFGLLCRGLQQILPSTMCSLLKCTSSKSEIVWPFFLGSYVWRNTERNSPVLNTFSAVFIAGFAHAKFVGWFLKCSKQTQAKNRLNAMTSPILKNLWTVYRFWPDFCLHFTWNFEDFELPDKIGMCKSGLWRSMWIISGRGLSMSYLLWDTNQD